jgi:flavorubredoxin
MGRKMIFEETSKSLFPSDLFIQPGDNNNKKPVITDDRSESMINPYRSAGIFGSEEPVRQTTKRLVNLSPKMVYPMHGSCIDSSIFPKYTDAIMKNNFAYSGMLLGQKMEMIS